MKRKAFLIMAGLWMGLIGLTACGGVGERAYPYPETATMRRRICTSCTIHKTRSYWAAG